jgi:hypothetical protein
MLEETNISLEMVKDSRKGPEIQILPGSSPASIERHQRPLDLFLSCRLPNQPPSQLLDDGNSPPKSIQSTDKEDFMGIESRESRRVGLDGVSCVKEGGPIDITHHNEKKDVTCHTDTLIARNIPNAGHDLNEDLTRVNFGPGAGENNIGNGLDPHSNPLPFVFKDEDGQQHWMTFTPASMTSAPSAVDVAKNAFEYLLGAPIAWWPLKRPRKICPSDHMRLTWNCGHQNVDLPLLETAAGYLFRTSATSFDFDIPNSHFGDYLRWLSMIVAATNAPLLPTHQPPDCHPGGAAIASSTLSISNRSTTGSSSSSAATLRSGATTSRISSSKDSETKQPRDEYLHWCVDLAKAGTELVEFDLKDIGDSKLVPTLLKAYRTVRGISGWLSLTTCSGATLIKVSSCSAYRHSI